jgi:murein DD-endopeptidase MepM/ murein hydrolase activator NlpD
VPVNFKNFDCRIPVVKSSRMKRRMPLFVAVFLISLLCRAQSYPQNYFRQPLDIPMQLVANFGEIRANHWHMGLDIRTQHRVNLPVHAAAEGYIARVSIEPGGFGQAIYINHPNGYTTVYGHLNSFVAALADYVKQKQYEQQSWSVNLVIPANLFAVKKGDLVALSGSTGASEGPHVHFEIRDTKTENCLNPLLFNFPIADAVPPTVMRLAVYDRNKSTWEQSPQILAVWKSGSVYSVAGNSIRVGSDKVSFAIGAVDHFSGSTNPNGIYSAEVLVDGRPVSGFALDDISYDDTRYINGQLDYPYKVRGGSSLQHVTPLPGAQKVAYHLFNGDGMIHFKDNDAHQVVIEVKDADENISKVQFSIQYDENIGKAYQAKNGEKFLPNNVNVFERDRLEVFTTEKCIYDTVTVDYSETADGATSSVSPLFKFFSAAIPSHDSVTIRIKPAENMPSEWRDRVVIRNVCGERTYIQKGQWQKGWYSAKFRQFGTFQAFIDKEAPTVNAPPTNLSKASRIVFVPRDNFNTIESFRAELDGKWLRFSNDKGKTWIYSFDDHFPRGRHELKVIVADAAGNVTTRVWQVTR